MRGLCRELGLLHCTDPLVRLPLWGDPWYLRLHGGEGYRHRYSVEELSGLASSLKGRAAFVLFNNVSMLDDARAFVGLIDVAP